MTHAVTRGESRRSAVGIVRQAPPNSAYRGLLVIDLAGKYTAQIHQVDPVYGIQVLKSYSMMFFGT